MCKLGAAHPGLLFAAGFGLPRCALRLVGVINNTRNCGLRRVHVQSNRRKVR